MRIEAGGWGTLAQVLARWHHAHADVRMAPGGREHGTPGRSMWCDYRVKSAKGFASHKNQGHSFGGLDREYGGTRYPVRKITYARFAARRPSKRAALTSSSGTSRRSMRDRRRTSIKARATSRGEAARPACVRIASSVAGEIAEQGEVIVTPELSVGCLRRYLSVSGKSFGRSAFFLVMA